jgi:exodeoxyribonuclease VII small subunit
MTSKKANKAESESLTFEDSLTELERIVGRLESGELGLADALEHYERGVKHLKACYGQLEKAERKIELLTGVDANGQPITEAFDDSEPASLESKAASRGKRRTTAILRDDPAGDGWTLF